MNSGCGIGICSKCGATLRPMDMHKFGSKNLCPACYAQAQAEAAKLEEERSKLSAYVKELFGLDDLPASFSARLDSLLRQKVEDGRTKTLKGAYFTIKYVYQIKNTTLDYEYLFQNINVFYIEAEKYWQEQFAICQNNSQHVSQEHEVVVRIKRPVSNRKTKYNMEDL